MFVVRSPLIFSLNSFFENPFIMAEQPINQAPAAQAPAPGAQPQDGNNTPATDPSQSAGGASQTPSGSSKVEVDEEELQALRRDAGRWRKKDDPKGGRENRRDRAPRDRGGDHKPNADDADPELLDQLRVRDEKISELTSASNKLIVKDKVRDLLDSEDYKKLPDAIKRAVVRNPLGFARDDSRTVEHFIEDIQDYLDDEIDALGDQTNAPANAGGNNTTTNNANNQPPRQTPPASGSGPAVPGSQQKEDVEGKTGQQRSRGVLRNLLRDRGLRQ